MNRPFTLAAALAASLWSSALGQDTRFLRGDSNGDGVVSLSDAYHVVRHVFLAEETQCASASDVDDDGHVDLTDIRLLACFATCGSCGPVQLIDPEHQCAVRPSGFEAPPPPFPLVGEDPTGDALGCGSYGEGEPVSDPGARIDVADVESSGDSASRISIVIRVSNTLRIAGYAGIIRFPDGVLADVDRVVSDLTDLETGGFMHATLDGPDLRFGFMFSHHLAVSKPAGFDIEVLEITACLVSGTPAGTYPLEVVEGELIDAESGMAIPAALGTGTLRVASDVTSTSAECKADPEPIDGPDLTARYVLQPPRRTPGGEWSVPFVLVSDGPVAGYAFSVNFDEHALEATGIESIWRRPDAADHDFADWGIENSTRAPGDSGVDEGYIVGGVTFSEDRGVTLPVDTPVELVRLRFAARLGAPPGPSRIHFEDGGRFPGDTFPVRNLVWAHQSVHAPEIESSVLIDPMPDVEFVRGDSNSDGRLDLSDPVGVLSYLFRSGPGPTCTDAADTDDSGRIDISDPIFALGVLFLGTEPMPNPFPRCGPDPTPDALECAAPPEQCK